MSAGIACVDLFCGAGGLTHGLIQAGLSVVAGVDLDDACALPYVHNNSGAEFCNKSVEDVAAIELRSWFGKADIRVLAGCAPCQPFSTLVQRYNKGREPGWQPKWGLMGHVQRLVEGVQPEIVCMENVPQVGSQSIFIEFVAALEDRGYQVWKGVVDSSTLGLPQRRRRMVLIASRLGKISFQPSTVEETQTVRDAIGSLPALGNGERSSTDPLHAVSTLSELNLKRIRASRPGGTWKDWPSELVAKCHRKDSGQSHRDVYGRMMWDKPAPTLTTRFHGFGNGRFGHPEQDRAISLREGAILQGFPDNYRFVEDNQRAQFKTVGRLIGNAVPVPLGKAIGETIRKHVQEAA